VPDAGLPADWREFASALSRLGYTRGDIDAVLISHHHVDHAGNAERLRSSGARVLSHAADAPYLRGEERRSNKEVVRTERSYTVDAALAVESLDVLAATNAQMVLPGHGEPWPHGVNRAVDLARQADR
jgi:glyoxylase-like metal-dependent hydrolase (beta-lactamase superfamily II)